MGSEMCIRDSHQNTGKSGNEIRGKGKGFVLAKSEWARMKAMKPYAGGK